MFEAKIAQLSADVEEKRKKSAGMLGSLLKEAEVGHVAAAMRRWSRRSASSPGPLSLFASRTTSAA